MASLGINDTRIQLNTMFGIQDEPAPSRRPRANSLSRKACAMHRLSWSKHLGGGFHLRPVAARRDDSGSSAGSKHGSNNSRTGSPAKLDAAAKHDSGGALEGLARAMRSGNMHAGAPARVFSRSRLARNPSSESASTYASDWGFYEEEGAHGDQPSQERLGGTRSEVEVPDYVLEATLDDQVLWHATAGQRPPQPLAERRAAEAAMRANFEKSCVAYDDGACPPCGPPPGRAAVPILREPSPFGTSVTKSFQCDCCGERTSLMIRIPKFQIVRERSGVDLRAEYLVVARLGGVTFGIWRRHSHFLDLQQAIAKEPDADVTYRNTLWSWRCLKRRQRLFRCLDKDYLAVKCFLLERFLHDAVFESSSSAIFSTFLGLRVS